MTTTGANLRLEYLGGLRATLAGEALSLPSKAQALLCYLAVTARPQPREVLAGLFWSDVPEAAARASLRALLPKLRRALGPYLDITRDAVAFDGAPGYDLDVERFLSALTQLEADADPDRLRRAVTLYQGDFLAGVPLDLESMPLFEEWLAGQRERFKQLAVQALHLLAAHHTGRGEAAPATDYLGRLLALEPWREESHRQLMTLLAQSGQRDAALAQYARCSRALREELGLAPSPETEALYGQIRAGRLTEKRAPRHTRPAPPTPLLGRGADIAQLGAALRQGGCRLVTLYGIGGVGKTRLAQGVAEAVRDEFPDGAHFVSLAAVTDPARVPDAILATLALQPNRDALGSLKAYLAHRRALLVLDNFEQVAAAAAAVEELLEGAPGLKIMVTSRALLHLHGEQQFPVAPLAVPDLARLPGLSALRAYPAVALFCERAARVSPGFALSPENAPAVAAICVRLDGLPLALELAAARVKLLGPHDILSRLGKRMAFLGGAQPRRTLRDAVAWSFDLLQPREKDLFCRLGTFSGGATLEAVQDVGGLTELEALDGLSALLDAGLIQRCQGQGEGRVSMLETIREFALDGLAASGALEAAQRAHAAHFLGLATGATLTGKEQAAWLARLTLEQDNLRVALRWLLESGEAEAGVELAAALWRFWHMRGHLQEGRAWLEALLALPGEEVPSEARADARGGAGVLAWMQGQYVCARTHLERSLGLYQALGNTLGMAKALNNLGAVAYLQEDYTEAQRCYEASLARFAEAGDPTGVAQARGNLSLVLYLLGDLGRARQLCEDVLASFRATGDGWSVVTSLNNLARVVKRQGEWASAAALLAEGLRLGREVGAARVLADVTEKVAGLAARRGKPLCAARLWGATEAYREQIGAPQEIVSRPGYARDLAIAKVNADADTFAAAWAEGRAAPFEEALGWALALSAEQVAAFTLAPPPPERPAT